MMGFTGQRNAGANLGFNDDHGDQPRPLPVIKELKKATDITERKGTPSWDYDEVKGCWLWKLPPPESRKRGDYGTQVDGTSVKRVKRKTPMMSVSERLLKEFSCLICRNVMVLPLTTPCAHNFCKTCLEGAFAGQTFVRQRTCEGRRTLRAQKNIMKCPSCSNDISEFLQNPQVNRELMSVIESLQSQSNEPEDSLEIGEESSDSDEKKEETSEVTDGIDGKADVVVGITDVCDSIPEIMAEDKDDQECIKKPSPEKKPKQTRKKKADDGDNVPEKKPATMKNDDAEVKPIEAQIPDNKEVEAAEEGGKPRRTSKCTKVGDAGVKTRNKKPKQEVDDDFA